MIDTLQSEPVAVAVPPRPAGKVVRSIAGYGLLAALMLLTPLFVFTPAVLLQCGVRNGRRGAWISFVIAAILVAAIEIPSAHVPGIPATDVKLTYAFLAARLLALALPSLVILPMVERSEPFGRVLMTAVICSVAGLVLTEAGMRVFAGFSPYTALVAQTKMLLANMITTATQKNAIPGAAAGLKAWSNIYLECVPGFVIAELTVIFIFSLVIFGRLRVWREFLRTHNAGETTPYLFRKLSLPEWLLFFFVLSGLSPLASGIVQKVGANVLVVVVFLYFVQGLAIFRAILAAVGAGFAGVLLGYGALVLLAFTGISPLLLGIAGLFDSFFDFRHFKRKDDSNESHFD
jgi:hypothetical protein